MSEPQPLLVARLLRKVDNKLIELLRELRAEEWDLPTIVPQWQVRDIAAHLLDTPLRKLSMVRDGCFVERPTINSPKDLVAFVNRLNHEGVAVYRRLSPTVFVDLLTVVCEQYAMFHESLDPFAPATFAVSWAGEASSLNWFDTARDLTERWHHQQQIRLAVNRPGIMTPELYHPVLDCFVRGLPFHFRDVEATTGTTVVLRISGACGGEWTLRRDGSGWVLLTGVGDGSMASIAVPEEIAWRVFTKGIRFDEARSLCTFQGDTALAEHVLSLTSIVG